MDFFTCEIPVSGYVEAILDRRQILYYKIKNTLSQILCKVCWKKIQKHK